MAIKKHDYWYFKNVLDKKKVKELDSYVSKNCDKDEPKDNAARGHAQQKIKYLTTKMIRWGKVKHLLNDVQDLIMYTNKESFGYDLYSLRDMDYVNYNVYSAKTKDNYGWHVDATGKPYKDIKLTVLLNVSTQPYKGGTFNIFANEPCLINEFNAPGDILILRSYINHLVMPVTSGERKTLALFMEGPLFK